MTQPIGGSFKPFAAAYLALFAVAVDAADTHWNAGTAPWETAANWDTGLVPTAADNVYIANGGTPQVTGTDVAGPLTISSGGLDLESGSLTSTGTANIAVNAGETANVTVSGGSSLTLGPICFSGNGGNATMSITDGTVTANGGNNGIGEDDSYSICGTNSSSSSSLLVDGANSAFYAYGKGSATTVGGNVTIQNGGRMEVHNSHVYMGPRANLVVDGEGSLFLATGSNDPGIGGFGGIITTDPMYEEPDTSFTVANGGRFELRIYFQSNPVQIRGGIIEANSIPYDLDLETDLNIGTGGAPGFFDLAEAFPVWGYMQVTFDHNAPDYYFTNTGTAAGTPVALGDSSSGGSYPINITSDGPGTTILNGPLWLPGSTLRIHHGKLVIDGVQVDGQAPVGNIFDGTGVVNADGELDLINGATMTVGGTIWLSINDQYGGPAVLRIDGDGSKLEATTGETQVFAKGSLILSNGGWLNAVPVPPDYRGHTQIDGGEVDIGAPAGQPPVAPGRFTASLGGYVPGNYVDGNIVVNHTATRYVLSDSANTLLITPGNALTHLAGDTYIETANTYDNTYDKGTTISGGTLSVFDVGAGASALGTAPVLVNGTGTLGGGGEVPSVHLASGGTLDPSYPDDPDLPYNDPFGTLTIAGDLQMDAGSHLRFDANRSGVGAGGHLNDLIAVNGNATLGGVVDIIPGTPFLLNGNIVMMTYTGTLSGTLGIGSSPPGFACAIDTTSTPGEVLLHMVPATTPAVSLSVTDAGGGYAPYGQTATYTVTLTNNDSASVTDIALTSTLSTALYATNATWTCQGSGGASCPAASGGGALFGTGIALPVGGSLTWTVNVPVLDAAQQDSASFSAGATYAGTVASDDTLVLFRDGFDGN
jgi:uncharacterized repeat protein (TIGR01451 family)